MIKPVVIVCEKAVERITIYKLKSIHLFFMPVNFLNPSYNRK